MSEKVAWYSRGKTGIDSEKQRRQDSEKPRRFWLPPGKGNNCVFLDDESFNVYEYNWFANNSWMNWATKSPDADAEAVFREKGLNPYFCAYRTIVNCTEWEDKQGKKHNYELQFLPAKNDTAQLIERRREHHEGLVGKMFTITRNEGDRTTSAGDDYVFKKDVDINEMLPYVMYKGNKFIDLVNQANEDDEKRAYLTSKFAVEIVDGVILPKLVPFNYPDLLAPPSPREAKIMLAGASSRASGKGSGSGDDDIPF